MAHVPPKPHLRKVQKRLARVEALGLHEAFRVVKGGPRFRMPSKRDRRDYTEAIDLLFRDLDRLLDDLLEEDDEERDQR